MSEPYTPTTEEVRASYLSALTHNHPMNVGEVIAEFERWLASVKAEAWEQGAKMALLSEGYDTVEHAKVLESNPHRKEPTHEHN